MIFITDLNLLSVSYCASNMSFSKQENESRSGISTVNQMPGRLVKRAQASFHILQGRDHYNKS